MLVHLHVRHVQSPSFLVQKPAGFFIVVMLFFLIGTIAAHRRIKVDFMSVKIWTVDAGKTHLAIDNEAAAAAHAGTVDHDRVHGGQR